MLLIIIFTNLLILCFGQEASKDVSKPYLVIPVPLDFPNRNDKSEQCWLRIEDTELVETFSIFCYISKSFLNNYLYDYNSRKMSEDGAVVKVWEEDGKDVLDMDFKPSGSSQKVMKDWKATTYLDPIMHRRVYVSQKADCKLIFYTREGVLNQKVDCEKFLFYLNSKMSDESNSAMSAIVKMDVVVVLTISLFCTLLFNN